MNTAQDIAAYLLASTGGGAQDGEHSAVRQAVINGVREVMQARNWLWHTRTGSFTTGRIATTGTITNGSKDIVVANATGFVPGRIVSIPATYFPTPMRVAAVNGNVVTLDVAARQSGTGVTVMPATYYDLPAELKDIDTLLTNTVGTLHCYLSPEEWQRLQINTQGAGEPYYYTIMRSDVSPDRWQIRFVGVPTDNTVVQYTYRITPQPIKYIGYERQCRQGTVQVTLNSSNVPIVTGTGTAFPPDCAGSYIRFGAQGMEAEAVGANFPFVMERRIEQWNSATSLVLSSRTVYTRNDIYGNTSNADPLDGGTVAAPGAGPVIDGGSPGAGPSNPYTSQFATLPANTKYAVTDVIDASSQMWTAMLSAAEMWYARVAGKPAADAMALFNRDIRIAMENDQVAPYSGRPHGRWYPTPRSMGWHSVIMPDYS